MNFGQKKKGETVPLGFDVVRVIGVNGVITDVSFSVTTLRGVDANPEAMKSGSPLISGTEVSHDFIGGEIGCYYEIEAAISANGKLYIERGTLEVIA